MKKTKILALLLVVAMLASMCLTPVMAADEPVATSDEATLLTAKPTFTDTEDSWAVDSIDRWANAGVVSGHGDGTFKPGDQITRAEFAQILVNLLGLKKPETAPTFADLKGTEWYADAIARVAAAGIMQGDGTNCMAENKITRQEAMVMLGRALGVKQDTSTHAMEKFADGEEVADWAKGYLAPLTQKGILSGVPGEDDTVSVLPVNLIDRASTMALLDKAIKEYITEPGEYTVDDANGYVVVNVPAPAEGETQGEVKVSGDAAGLVVATGNDAPVSAKVNAETVKVDAPSDVTLEKGSNVDTVAVNEEAKVENNGTVANLEVNAPAAIDNKGTVTNLNTNASGVVMDGNKPANITTADGVEPAKDSSGKDVTEQPTSSGGSSGGGSSTPSYKYKVSLPSVTGGTVTADVTQTDTADTTVTLTVTPDDGYLLTALTVTAPTEGATATDISSAKSFSMNAEGTWKVEATFIKLLNSPKMYVITGAEGDFEKMTAMGYPEDAPLSTDLVGTTAGKHQYLFIGIDPTEEGIEHYKANNTNKMTVSLTANGNPVTVDGATWSNGAWNWLCAWIDATPENLDKEQGEENLGITDDYATIEGKIEWFGITYTLDPVEYTRSLKADEEELPAKVTVTVQNGSETTTYPSTAGKKITLPTPAEQENAIFQQWMIGDEPATLDNGVYTVGDADVTITAKYVQIKSVTPTTRGISTDNVPYPTYYQTFGVSMSGSVITVDQATFAQALANEENATAHAAICQKAGTDNDNPFFGVAAKVPEGAVKFKAVDDAGEEYSGTIASANGTAGFSFYDDAEGQKWAAYYVHFIRYDGAATTDRDVTVTVTYTDADGKVLDNGAELWKCSKQTNDEKGTYSIVASYAENDTETLASGEVTYNDFLIKTKRERWTAVETAAGEKTLSKAGYELGEAPEDSTLTWDFATQTVTKTIPATAIAYAVTVNEIPNGNWTVKGNGKTGDEAATNVVGEADEKPGYTFDGWYYAIPEDEDGNTTKLLTKELTFSVKAEELPNYAVQGDDKGWTVTFTPVYKASALEVAAMSAEDYTAVMTQFFGGADKFPAQEKIAAITAIEDDKLVVTPVDGTGELAYVENFTAFNKADETEQNGYYVLVTFKIKDVPNGTTIGDDAVIAKLLGKNEKNFTYKQFKNQDGTWDGCFAIVHFLGADPANADEKTMNFIEIDLDGDDTDSDAITYKLDWSGLKFAAKPAPSGGEGGETNP